MKELSIKEKARCYDKALEKAKILLKTIGNATLGNLVLKNEFENMFPELKESEDEKMMNQLHSWMKEFGGAEEYTEKVYQWLKGLIEKKGEQNPTIEMKTPEESLGIDSDTYNKIVDECVYGEQKPAWGEDDAKMLGYTLAMVEWYEGVCEKKNLVRNWLKSLKDRVQSQHKQEWSEEDERSIRDSIFYLKSAKKYFEKDDNILWDEKWFNLCIKWLESLYKMLRPQNTWKPSDEQMNVLNEVFDFAANHESPHWNDYIFGTLNNLIRQLKKLKK